MHLLSMLTVRNIIWCHIPSGRWVHIYLVELTEVKGKWRKKRPSTVTPSCTALDLFCRFLAQEAWELLVEETNRYAASVVGHTPHARKWINTTVAEMKAFLGMMMMMGVLRCARFELYWSTMFPLINTPGISSPPCLPDYQAYMRGVNRGDQLQSYYNMVRRSKKVLLFSWVFSYGCVRQAEHARKGRGKRDKLKFRLELGHQLVGSYCCRSRAGRPRSSTHAQLSRLSNSHQHWPVFVTGLCL